MSLGNLSLGVKHIDTNFSTLRGALGGVSCRFVVSSYKGCPSLNY